jgi:hypothetical protein
LGGRLSALLSIRFRGVWLLQMAVLTQIAIIYLLADGGGAATYQVVHLGTYAGAAVFVWRNRRVCGMGTLAVGGMANLAAIVANAGVMPTLPRAATIAGLAHTTDGFQNSAVTSDSPLWFLGDVFAIPQSVPLANVFSVGDVLLLAAGLTMVWVTAGVRLPRARARILRVLRAA